MFDLGDFSNESKQCDFHSSSLVESLYVLLLFFVPYFYNFWVININCKGNSVFIYTNGKLLMVQLKKSWVLLWGPTFRWLVVHLFMPYLFSKSLSLDRSYPPQDYCTIAIFIFLFLTTNCNSNKHSSYINNSLCLIKVWFWRSSHRFIGFCKDFLVTSLYRVIHGSFRTGVCDGVLCSWEVFDVFL